MIVKGNEFMIKHFANKFSLASSLYLMLCTNVLSHDIQVVTENWPPFNYQNTQGEVVGSITSHVKEILSLSALSHEINLYPWARTYKLAESKKNHLIYSLYKTPEREKHFHWFCPIAPSIKLHLIKLSTSDINITHYTQAKAYKVGVVRKDAPNMYLLSKGFIAGINLYETTNETSNIQQLLNGSVDFIVQSQPSIDYRLSLLKKSKSMVELSVELPISSNDVCMAMNINSDIKIVNKLKEGFDKWKKQGLK